MSNKNNYMSSLATRNREVIYKNSHEQIAIEKDSNDKKLYIYVYTSGIIQRHSRALLKELNIELFDDISEFFSIDLFDYDVHETNESYSFE